MSNEEPLMYSQFCYYIQKDEEKRRATMHIPRKPGEQIEVDWAGDPAHIIDPDTGEITDAWIFVGVLTYSQYAFVKAYMNEKTDNWIKAHVQMFDFFGGVTPMLVSDNCTTAVNHKKSDWYNTALNTTYREMAEHYNLAILPERVRKPKDKPNVEGSVGKISTWIIHLNNIRFTEMMPSVTEQLTNGCYRFSVFCNLLNQYCRSGDINNRDGYAGELLDLFYDVLPLVDDTIYDEDMKRRCYAVNRILLMVWAYIKEVTEKAEEEENTSETLQKLNKEIPQMAEVPSLNGTPIAAGGSVDTQKYISGRAEIEEKLRKATEQESGRIPWMKTDDFDEGAEGSVEQNLSYHGAGYSTAGDDISRILTAAAKEKVQEELSLALTEEMQQEAEHIRLGNAHSGIKIIINRMQEIEESYIQQYQSVAPPLLAISKQIQKRLQRVFKDMSFTGKESALLMGRRIEPRLLMDRKGRFFSRNRLPSEKKSLAVAVLMDESGSMADQDRVTYARAAGIIIYDFCKAMDVPILIMGHTDDSNVQIYAYTDFDSMDKMDRYRLMDLSARYGNRDGAALRYVAERLLKQPEEKKLLLLVSDGQPAGTGGYLGSATEADLRGIKKEYTNKGILFVAAAIGDDKENIERIYGDAFLDISDLTKLPFLLVKKIEKELKG